MQFILVIFIHINIAHTLLNMCLIDGNRSTTLCRKFEIYEYVYKDKDELKSYIFKTLPPLIDCDLILPPNIKSHRSCQ